MKKAVSLFLVILLAFSLSTAFAKRLDYQLASGKIADYEDFKARFIRILSDENRSIDWPSEPYKEDGYEVYDVMTAQMDDGTVDIAVYTKNGNVEYIVITGSVYDEGNNMDWLLDNARDACFTTFGILYINDYQSGGDHTPEGIADEANNEWNKLLLGLSEDHGDMIAYATDVLGFPTGIWMYEDGSTTMLYIYVLNKNSRLWAE